MHVEFFKKRLSYVNWQHSIKQKLVPKYVALISLRKFFLKNAGKFCEADFETLFGLKNDYVFCTVSHKSPVFLATYLLIAQIQSDSVFVDSLQE